LVRIVIAGVLDPPPQTVDLVHQVVRQVIVVGDRVRERIGFLGQPVEAVIAEGGAVPQRPLRRIVRFVLSFI
jgi:hypothetical protein